MEYCCCFAKSSRIGWACVELYEFTWNLFGCREAEKAETQWEIVVANSCACTEIIIKQQKGVNFIIYIVQLLTIPEVADKLAICNNNTGKKLVLTELKWSWGVGKKRTRNIFV